MAREPKTITQFDEAQALASQVVALLGSNTTIVSLGAVLTVAATLLDEIVESNPPEDAKDAFARLRGHIEAHLQCFTRVAMRAEVIPGVIH